MNTSFPRPVPVPADIEVEARLIGPFTARQSVILAVTAAAALAAGEAAHAIDHRSPVAVLAAVGPLIFAGLALVLIKPGGVPLDRLLCAAIGYVRAGRRQAMVPQHMPLPAGVGRLSPAYQRITEANGHGIVELEDGQTVVVLEVEPRCLQLADANEARALLAGIGTVLAAQNGPFSVSTLTERVSLGAHAESALAVAETLATRHLVEFARRQASYLRDLAEGAEIWRRRHLVALREAGSGAAARAAHRATAALQLLESCGFTVRILDPGEVTALLTAACDPERSVIPRTLGPVDHPVTARLGVRQASDIRESA